LRDVLVHNAAIFLRRSGCGAYDREQGGGRDCGCELFYWHASSPDLIISCIYMGLIYPICGFHL
jgi:hypothetical protein